MTTEIKNTTTQQVTPAKMPEPVPVYVPYVDIYETGEDVRLWIEMPGVDSKSVDVKVENHVLTVEGRTEHDSPKDHKLVGREFELGLYRRAFELSDRIATEGIKARMKNGVLQLVLPKPEQAKRRTVAIDT